MQDNYACLMTPSQARTAYLRDSHGKSTTAYLRNRIDGNCAQGLRSLAISLGTVIDTSGVLTTATVETVEFGTQAVLFAVDGRYVSAVMGAGRYILHNGTAALSSGSHTVTATVVDAVGVLAVSGKQSVAISSGVGPAGPVSPNVDPAKQDFEVAGNVGDPINGRR